MNKSKIGTLIITGLLSSTLLVSCGDSDVSTDNSTDNPQSDSSTMDIVPNDEDEIKSVVNAYYEMHQTPMVIPNNFNSETNEISSEFIDENGEIIDADNPDEILEYIKSTADFNIDDYFNTSSMTDEEKNELYGTIVGIRMFMPIQGSIDESNIEIKDKIAYAVLSEEMTLPEAFLKETDTPIVKSTNINVKTVKMIKTDNGWRMDFQSYLSPETIQEENTPE